MEVRCQRVSARALASRKVYCALIRNRGRRNIERILRLNRFRNIPLSVDFTNSQVSLEVSRMLCHNAIAAYLVIYIRFKKENPIQFRFLDDILLS